MATSNKKTITKKANTKSVGITKEIIEEDVTPVTVAPEDVVLSPESDSDTSIPDIPDEPESETSPEDVIVPLVEEDNNDDDTDDGVIMTPESKSHPIERKVKICLAKDHSCSIGGIRYHFEAGKSYNVPEGVKSILRQAGLLSAI